MNIVLIVINIILIIFLVVNTHETYTHTETHSHTHTHEHTKCYLIYLIYFQNLYKPSKSHNVAANLVIKPVIKIKLQISVMCA